MIKKLANKENKIFEFDSIERMLIDNRINQISDKINIYKDSIIYKDILGLKAGIVFITYEYRNELAEYLRENNYDMDFVMMIALDKKVVSYRSVRDNVSVRIVAEYFGGKGHDVAATNPITDLLQEQIIDMLISKE